MKHVYGILLFLLGIAAVGAAFFCPIVKGIIAVILFLVGGSCVSAALKLATGKDLWTDEEKEKD